MIKNEKSSLAASWQEVSCHCKYTLCMYNNKINTNHVSLFLFLLDLDGSSLSPRKLFINTFSYNSLWLSLLLILSLSPSSMPSHFFSGNLFLFPSQSLMCLLAFGTLECPCRAAVSKVFFKMPSSRHCAPQIWVIGTLLPSQI